MSVRGLVKAFCLSKWRDHDPLPTRHPGRSHPWHGPHHPPRWAGGIQRKKRTWNLRGFAMDFWLVARCGSGKTMRLVDGLNSAGVSAWTPMLSRIRRLPRSPSVGPVMVPILPSFVFVLERQGVFASDLAERRQVPSFSWMRFIRKIVCVSDGDLSPMRGMHLLETSLKPDAPALGQEVAFCSGGFEGMTGVVLKVGAKDCLVLINGGRGIKVSVPPFLLRWDRA